MTGGNKNGTESQFSSKEKSLYTNQHTNGKPIESKKHCANIHSMFDTNKQTHKENRYNSFHLAYILLSQNGIGIWTCECCELN